MRYRTIKAHHVWGFTHDLQNTPNFLFFFFFFFTAAQTRIQTLHLLIIIKKDNAVIVLYLPRKSWTEKERER